MDDAAMREKVRGSGRTTNAMKAAPLGAVYVWCNRHLHYPAALAQKLGRQDLNIVSPSWLENDQWRGVEIAGLVLDHASDLTDEQWRQYWHVKAGVKALAKAWEEGTCSPSDKSEQ